MVDNNAVAGTASGDTTYAPRFAAADGQKNAARTGTLTSGRTNSSCSGNGGVCGIDVVVVCHARSTSRAAGRLHRNDRGRNFAGQRAQQVEAEMGTERRSTVGWLQLIDNQ